MKNKSRVLFVYPNERQMSTIPPAIALLSQLLKQKGHITDIFDTTFYEFEDDPEAHARLSKEFIDTYWSKRDDDLRDAAKGLF